MTAPAVHVQHVEQTRHRSVAPRASMSPSRRLQRLLPELVALAVCGVLWVQAAGLSTTADGPGPALFPRLLLGLLGLSLLVRLGHEWRAGRIRAGSWNESAVEASARDGVPAVPVSGRRLAVAIALVIGYVAASVLLGWVLATFGFVVAFLHAAGARRLRVTVPVAAALAVGLALVFGRVVYLSLPVGRGIFAELTLRFFGALGVY